MKRMIVILLVLLLIIVTSIPVCAATPAIKIPHIALPDLSVSVRETVKDILPNDFWSGWFKTHPILVDLSKVFYRYE